MKRIIILFAATFSFALVSTGYSRLFTDTDGRQVEAELIGLRGQNIVLTANGLRGQWPVAKLAQADQAYVNEWKTNHSGVDHVGVRTFEKDGIGEKGAFTAKEAPAPAVPNLPIEPSVEVKPIYKHYEVDLNNPATVDAAHLQADYVLYVISADGRVSANSGRQEIPTIPTSKTSRITTEGVTASKTKATKLKITFTNNSLSTTEKTQRSSDQFGGVWVKVYSVEGKVIGEQKQLTPALSKLNPSWEEVAEKEDIPLIKSFEAFKELIKKVLPPKPQSGSPEPPKLPRLP